MPKRQYQSNHEIFQAYSQGNFWHTAWGKLINRSFLVKNKIQFEKGIYHEDELWCFDIMRHAQNILTTPKVVYNYRKRAGSITSCITTKHIQDMNLVISKMYEVHCQNKQYLPKEMSRIIERFRRSTLQKIFTSTDINPRTKLLEINKTKSIKLPICITSNGRYIRQNLLLRMPTRFIIGYLSWKWKRYQV